MKKSRAVVAPLAVAAALALGACGASPAATEVTDTPSAAADEAQAPAGSYNQADVTFVTRMLPHHEQAVELADLALELSENQEVLDLAERVKAAQDPEIDTLNQWLDGWGPAATAAPAPAPAPAPADPAAPAPPADPAAPAVPAAPASPDGMLTTEQMDTLANSRGDQFDQLWIQMMIEHHQGAVALADAVLQSGENPEVKHLAQNTKRAQTAQVRELRMLQ